MADNWDNITVGMKVEVQNTDCDNFSEDFPDSFWVATVLKISGKVTSMRAVFMSRSFSRKQT